LRERGGWCCRAVRVVTIAAVLAADVVFATRVGLSRRLLARGMRESLAISPN